jgi:hypothetical protein
MLYILMFIIIRLNKWKNLKFHGDIGEKLIFNNKKNNFDVDNEIKFVVMYVTTDFGSVAC